MPRKRRALRSFRISDKNSLSHHPSGVADPRRRWGKLGVIWNHITTNSSQRFSPKRNRPITASTSARGFVYRSLLVRSIRLRHSVPGLLVDGG
jgi:hypothetical protein